VSRKLRTGKVPATGEQPPPAAEAVAAPTAHIPVEKGKELQQWSLLISNCGNTGQESVRLLNGTSAGDLFNHGHFTVSSHNQFGVKIPMKHPHQN
jgi:hypothetical protein